MNAARAGRCRLQQIVFPGDMQLQWRFAMRAMIALLCAAAAYADRAAPLNVLLIAVDDLRTEISPYPEGAHMHTPNLERLANRSVVFERAYVQVATVRIMIATCLSSPWACSARAHRAPASTPALAAPGS